MYVRRWMMLLLCMLGPRAEAQTLEYMGQDPPGVTVQRFAPGVISLDDREEQGLVFSPDGKECYFTVSAADWSSYRIMMTRVENGAWTPPKTAPFSNDYSLSPSLSPDGTRLYFSSNRRTDGKQAIWQCRRTKGQQWSSPQEMNRQVSSAADEWSCHLSDQGNMYVCSWRAGGQGRCDGWRITDPEGPSAKARNLKALNTGGGDCGVVPGPKERYVIFQSERPDGRGKPDLYISHALAEGRWSEPRNLGPTINSPEFDGGPWITYDGRYLFFTSRRSGNADIYWVETKAFLTNPESPRESPSD